ncbi:Methyltransferase type 11 [Cordyceps fumosorosea ARSEF 2679]|uniref:Methyltransferase type 11 n=1 Tax=Cordyceps fumosorosea (strain ARSEF 2679) TaxID=1081104 RepID=A0A167WPB6_CORFA|nr:Methyltransferase type 11 [Cordyceps fumosorosea ARSEF 2679]OAA64044.1 Methyltransferase type 11 [Cordyceps fumosorosea ARSEF 2679]
MSASAKIPSDVEALYDQVSAGFRDAWGDCDPAMVDILESIRESHASGSSVLDIGCGPGGPASRLIKAGYHVTGIDLSQKMIDICQATLPGKFMKTDMRKFEPKVRFDIIVCSFSLFHVSHAATYSMLVKMASWLRPSGTVVIASIAAEDYSRCSPKLPEIQQKQYVENILTNFMGHEVPATLLTTKEWLRILQEASFQIQSVDRHSRQVDKYSYDEKHIFITANRTHEEPLFGPYPLPTVKRRPHLLSNGALEPFVKRLTRRELEAALEAVKDNEKVLSIGSGNGELPVWIAKRAGTAYALKPNCDRSDVEAEKWSESQVEISQGAAEHLPFKDNKFDAAVAVWQLHYVQDLELSLREMTRVVDATAPNARIVIVQGAPDNEVAKLTNKACAEIVEEGMAKGESAADHHGLLLATAARVFTQRGFGDIEVCHVQMACNFPEEDVETRCQVAAEVLTNFWYKEHERVEDIKAAFVPVLKEHFASSPWEVGAQAVMMVAKPKAVAGEFAAGI